MALITSKVASKVASLLIPKEKKNEMTQGIIFLMLGVIALPIILVTALFSGTTSDEKDNYAKAFDSMGCGKEYAYQLEDVRFFDSYTKKDNLTESTLSVNDIKNRLEQNYFLVGKGEEGDKVCLLKTDEDILETLEKKYNVSNALKEEILETITQIRDGRSNFKLPLETQSIISDYSEENKRLGTTFSVKANEDVKAIADGKVTEIKTNSDTFLITNGEEELEIKKGLTLTLQHDMKREMNEEGEFKMITLYSTYTCLKNVKLSVGDSVSQGDVIAKTSDKYLYFEMLDAEKKPVDPNRHIFMGLGKKFAMPLDTPFTVTSPVGERAGGFHFGMDVAGAYGARLYSISDGEVVSTNSTCSPNGGPSKCPTTGSVQGGGNFVVIKSMVDDKEYYIQYAHMDKINASKGQRVYAGQLIGYQGNSGNSFGTHCHIEAHIGGIHTANKESLFDVNEWLKLTLP